MRILSNPSSRLSTASRVRSWNQESRIGNEGQAHRRPASWMRPRASGSRLTWPVAVARPSCPLAPLPVSGPPRCSLELQDGARRERQARGSGCMRLRRGRDPRGSGEDLPPPVAAYDALADACPLGSVPKPHRHRQPALSWSIAAPRFISGHALSLKYQARLLWAPV